MRLPWAIIQEKYYEIGAIYRHWVASGAEPAAAIPGSQQGEVKYQIVNGTAIIPLVGILAKDDWVKYYGGTSTRQVARDFMEAMKNAAVKAIVLSIDSPGGTVDGTQSLAKLIYDSRGAKPITAIASGVVASAAYWIGSAADKLYLADDTTMAGSIGVIMTHYDWSKYDEKIGVAVTEIFAGKYKAVGSETKPLSDEDRDVLQDEVDYLYGIFVDGVAKNRGVDAATVLGSMADGRIFIGQQAVDAGLADGIKTIEEVLAAPVASAGVAVKIKQEVKSMDPQELTLAMIEQRPDLVASLTQRGEETGARAERERIQAVAAVAEGLPGHEAIVREMMFNGKTTGPEAAVKILAAEKQTRAKVLEGIATQSPAPAPVSMPEAQQIDASTVDPEDETAMKTAWDGDEKIRANFASFEGWLAFRRQEARGKIGRAKK
jgi:signal peptide peptidase SppA